MATITGDNSGNIIVGTSAGDVINANGGSDVVLGGNGNDTIDGGSVQSTVLFQFGWQTYLHPRRSWCGKNVAWSDGGFSSRLSGW